MLTRTTIVFRDMLTLFISVHVYTTVFLQAVLFVAFLVGFITVLCIGNYFRAKRAQERQKQRRDAKMVSSSSSNHHQVSGAYATEHGGSYEAPVHVTPPPQPTDPGMI